MNIEKILEYQKLDSELYKIEKQLRENKNKQTANQMHENMKNAQARSLKLEEKAGTVFAEIEKLKNQYKTQEEKIKEFSSKNLDKMSKEELEKYSVLKDKLNQNLTILEKNLSSLAETVNALLSDFNKTIKTFNTSKEQYLKSKESYDNDVKSIEEEKKEIADKLNKLETGIDGKIMELYKKKRNENLFPVVVPLKGNSCGGCHVELAYATISVLEKEGILTCEHCRRLIYKN